jgi:hypothetical protein
LNDDHCDVHCDVMYIIRYANFLVPRSMDAFLFPKMQNGQLA